MRRFALALVAVAACKHSEEVGTISGPPLLVDRSDAAAPAAPAPPIEAHFATVGANAVEHWAEIVDCVQSIVVGVSGSVEVTSPDSNATLGKGDAITLSGKGNFDVRGAGAFVRARVTSSTCDPIAKSKLFRAAAVKPLTWAGGKMHATLLVEKDDAKFVYAGLLDGTAGVAEHVHERSWEALCAIEAAGAFTLAGIEQRLGPKTCVFVPPNTKHSWTPDAGSTLSAVQFYVPAGPEQRFRGLAGAEQ